MAPVVFVHIGAFKTGTSFLQSRLWNARSALAEQGVLFPGEHGWGDQVRALSHVAGRLDPSGKPVPVDPWSAMIREIRAWPGPATVLSFEFLSLAKPRHIRQLVDDLAPAEVRVVITARDLVRVVPAMWQEVLQGGQTWSWPQYCQTVTSPVGRTVPPGRAFWRAHDLPALVRRWSATVPVGRIQLVTVPPSGAPVDELWRRFCRATSIDADAINLADLPAVPNESLDPASTELMRRVNLVVEGRMNRAVYDRVLKLFVAKKVLAGRSGPERQTLSAEHVRWARERGAQLVAELRGLGVPVVGDLQDLVGSADVTAGAEPSTEDVLAAAVDVIAALARRVGGGVDVGEEQEPVPVAGSRPVSRLVRTTYERLRH